MNGNLSKEEDEEPRLSLCPFEIQIYNCPVRFTEEEEDYKENRRKCKVQPFNVNKKLYQTLTLSLSLTYLDTQSGHVVLLRSDEEVKELIAELINLYGTLKNGRADKDMKGLGDGGLPKRDILELQMQSVNYIVTN